MKRLIPLLLLIIAPQAYSCIGAGQNLVCVGDKVYKGTSYSQGALVVSEDRFSQNVTIRSISSGSVYTENVQNLDITNGCLASHCVGDKVFKASEYSQGARILGINFYNRSITIQSISSSSLYVHAPENLENTQGCLGAVCVGEKVYKGAEYSQGAIVQSINLSQGSATIRSVSSSSLYSAAISDLDITRGCLGDVCVGEIVYKGSSYSQGARVLAVNSNKYTATIQSISSSNLYLESIYDLDSNGGNNPGPRPPRPPRPPGPGPIPPGPGPRPPTPRPNPITVQCTADRLDPSGEFVMSHTESVTGFPDRDLKREACDKALRTCESYIRGRQTCRIVR